MIDTVRTYCTPTSYTPEAFQKACSAGAIAPGTILENEDHGGGKTWALLLCRPPRCLDGYSRIINPSQGAGGSSYLTSQEMHTITTWKVEDQRAKLIQQYTNLPPVPSAIVAQYAFPEVPSVSEEELLQYTSDKTIEDFRTWSELPEIPLSMRQGLGVYLQGCPENERRPPQPRRF